MSELERYDSLPSESTTTAPTHEDPEGGETAPISKLLPKGSAAEPIAWVPDYAKQMGLD